MSGPLRQRREEPSASAEPVQLCCFTVGADRYVIDIKRVEEILEPMVATPLPRAPSFVDGVVTLRGGVMPVVDVRKRLRVDPSPTQARWRMLVVLIGRRRVGLLVDAVKEVLTVELSDLKPAPPLMGEGTPFVLGVCSTPGGLALLLDVKALVTLDLPSGLDAGSRERSGGGKT